MLFTFIFYASMFLFMFFPLYFIKFSYPVMWLFCIFLIHFLKIKLSSHFLSLYFFTMSFLISCSSNYTLTLLVETLSWVRFLKIGILIQLSSILLLAFWRIFLLDVWFFYAYFGYAVIISLHIFCMIPSMIRYWRSHVLLIVVLSADWDKESAKALL